MGIAYRISCLSVLCCFSALLLVVLFFSFPLSAQTQVSITASKDNTLYQTVDGSLSNGSGMHFFAGKTNTGQIRRGLVAFDVAGTVPAGVTILSATVRLSMSRSISGTETVRLHRVTKDWGEGSSRAGGEEGGGASAAIGDATWVHMFFNTALWETPGGDFIAQPSAAAAVGGVGNYTWGSTEALVADVQRWLDIPAENFGWILIGNESANTTAKRFDTREHTSTTARPLLTLTYSVPTTVTDEKIIPADIHLDQNYPNPFNPRTVVRIRVDTHSFVKLRIYNVLGENIATLVSDHLPAGEYVYTWDAGERTGGTYLCRLESNGRSVTRRMVLVK